MSLPPLTPDQSVKPPRFELRLSLLYAAIFLPMGIHLPYFPLWLEHVGFGAREIGIVLAAPMFLRVVTTLLITASADRARDRANVLLVLSVSTLALSFGYLLPPGYLLILGVSLALAVVWTPHAPIADSLALSGVRRFGSDYSRMRVWGSTAFLVANFGGGFLLSFHRHRRRAFFDFGWDGDGGRRLAGRASARASAQGIATVRHRVAGGRAVFAEAGLSLFRRRVRAGGGQPRLSLRVQLDLLAVARHQRRRYRAPVVVERRRGSRHVRDLHAIVRAHAGMAAGGAGRFGRLLAVGRVPR
jgi:hypothetical protein